MSKKFDVVLFGASGYTGQYVMPHMDRLLQENNISSWAIAGRNREKLEHVRTEASLLHVPIIVADVADAESLEKMTAQTRVLITLCGPFSLFGEPLIEACLKTGTHFIDITGENDYLKRVHRKYSKEAEEGGVYIVNSCGFDSLPVDLGVIFLQKRFNGTLNLVKSYLSIGSIRKDLKGPLLNYGTWKSAILSAASSFQLSAHFKDKARLHRAQCVPILNKWAIPIMSPDRIIAERSQELLKKNENIWPSRVETYFTQKSFMHTLISLFILAGLFVLTQFKTGVQLLLENPEFFSFGFLGRSPKRETIDNVWFQLILHGMGWESERPELYKEMVLKVSGTSPAYFTTSMGVIYSAICLINEKNKLPTKGGVYSPGALFKNTTLVEKLQKSGVNFEILSESEA